MIEKQKDAREGHSIQQGGFRKGFLQEITPELGLKGV